MKKLVIIYILTTIICIWVRFIGFIGESGNVGIMRENKNFEISSSYISNSGGYKDTRIHVILKESPGDLEKVFGDVKEFHNKMNGEPNRLAIYLYESREKLEAGEFIDETVFIKE